MKAQLELYVDLMKKYFGIEPRLKSKFQIHFIEWHFIGRYSNGRPRVLIGFPIDYGVRLLVDYGGDIDKIRDYIKWIKTFAKGQSVGDLARVMIPFFEIVKRSARQFFVECVKDDIAVRIRIKKIDEVSEALEKCARMAF